MDLTVQVSILPFCDSRFLEKDLFAEILHQPNLVYKKYKVFQEESYKRLNKHYHMGSLDMIYLLIEKYFPICIFQSHRSSNEIYKDCISRLAKAFICHRDDKIALKYWSNSCYEQMYDGFDGFTKVELWNTLSRQCCIDILVASYLIDNGMDEVHNLSGYYWLINIGDKQLDQILEQGVSENHIHINAGTDFHIMWEYMLDINNEILKNSQVLKELGRDKYKYLIYSVSIIRLLMTHYIANTKYSKEGNFSGFCEVFFQDNSEIKDENSVNNKDAKHNIRYILESILCGKIENIEETQMDFNEMYTYLIRDKSTIKEILGYRVDTSNENIFIFESLKHIKKFSHNDYAKLFWKYIVLKNIIYQGVTQNNYMGGLDYFQKYFEKAKITNQPRKEHLKICIKNQFYNNPLKKLEIRLSMPNEGGKVKIKEQLYKTLRLFFEVYKELLESEDRHPVPCIGIIFHFIKQKDKRFFEKCWCMHEINKCNQFYGELQKGYMEATQVLVDIRQEIPYISQYIVGIDAASLENNTEPWVFAPIFQLARESSHNRYIKMNERLISVQSLGFTYHVGEDYRHLLSGLRHIDEVLESFGYHAGDRIGHGIVLGIDVEKWCHENPVLMMPRIEYMENMLWLWGLGYNGILDKNLIDNVHIEREIMIQAEYIYKNIQGITIYSLWDAYKKRFEYFDPDMRYMETICDMTTLGGNQVDKIMCERVRSEHSIIWTADKLRYAYQCKCYLERMYEIIHLKVNKSEIEMLIHLQKIIKSKVSQKGIVVETNPTSNLAISGMERLFSHHITKLNDEGLEQGGNGLVVTINSDDPSVFNTNISNELGYIFYMLQDKGYSRSAILEWINKIREWGVNTSFIKISSKEQRLEEIDVILEYLR